MARLLTQFALGRNSLWPMGDKGRADAAFVNPMFILTKRRIRHVGPTATIGNVSVRSAGPGLWSHAHGIAISSLIWNAARRGEILGLHRRQRRRRRTIDIGMFVVAGPAHWLRTAAVILQKQNKSVFELSG